MIIRSTIVILILLTGCFIFFVESEEPQAIVILNMNNNPNLPRNFRTIKEDFKIETPHPLPTREGLERLNISGSAQFSEESLQMLIKQLGNSESLYIIDLRQEFHGFVDSIAISWYKPPRNWENINKTLQEIEKGEKQLLYSLLRQKEVTLYRLIKKSHAESQLLQTEAVPIEAERIATEQELVTKYGLGYLRIGVTDHLRPSDESVDRFITFMRDLPKERWVHIHCAAGIGRTTTFMSMYDMMLNAKHIKFEDIIKRQWLLGGANLKKLYHSNNWKQSYAEERLRFLQNFYEYCRTNIDNFQQSWSSYILGNQETDDKTHLLEEILAKSS